MPPRGAMGFGNARERAISGGRAQREARSPAASTPAARGDRDRQQAVAEVRQRGEDAPRLPGLAGAILSGISDYVRSGIIQRIEAGGTPVREDGIVIGVQPVDGAYFGRRRQEEIAATQRGGDGEARAAAAPATLAPAPTEEAPVRSRRRTEMGRRLEEENRRRRLAGLRRLGTRTLLGSDRFGTDTLGA